VVLNEREPLIQALFQVERPAGGAVSDCQRGKMAKRKWRVGDLLVDERCSPAVLAEYLRWTSGSPGRGELG